MKKIIAAVTVTLALILIVFAVGYTRVGSTELVRGVRVSRRTAVERLNYTGTVEYAGSASSCAKGSGIVQSVFFKNGDVVEQGDVVLAVLETYADIGSADILSALSSGSAENAASLLSGGGAASVYTAASSGVLSGLDLDKGGVFLKGQTLFKVSGQQTFQVQLAVSEKDISRVKKGQGVTVDCRALPNMLSGVVTSVGDTASQTGSSSGKMTAVKVTVAIEGSCADLKPGYTADCSIVTSKKEEALLAPYSAVLHDEAGGAFVYLSKGSFAEKTAVTEGGEYSNGVEISQGLSDGDIIVYDAAKVSDSSRTVVSEVTVYAK